MIRQLQDYTERAEKFFKKYEVVRAILFAAVVLFSSHSIFFKQYAVPNDVYWDEAYHVPSGAKYVAGVHFMEPHPPLGKMFIAWGEMLMNWGERHNLVKVSNGGKTYGLEKGEQMNFVSPDGMTFKGYRFFPALAGWFSVLIFAYVIVELTGQRRWVLLFLPLYLFDNALIALFRGAVLDSLMTFGSLLSVWGFLRLLNLRDLNKRGSGWPAFMMVLGFSIAALTKLLALIFILLWPLLIWFKRGQKSERGFLFKAMTLQVVFFAAFFCAVWGYHVNREQRIEPSLRFYGLFYASSDYEKLLLGLPNDIGSVRSFYVRVRDNLRFAKAYEDGVNPYDLVKGDSTASFPITWPFGARPVYFRNTYPDEEFQRHLFMIPNPVTWGAGLVAIIFSLGGLLVGFLFSVETFSPRGRNLLLSLSGLYLSYMIAVIAIRRMMYLVHYTLPLILTYFMFIVLLHELWFRARAGRVRRGVRAFALVFPFLAFGGFWYMKPLTFYEPITCSEANARGLFWYWNIRLNFCPNPAVSKHFLSKSRMDPKFGPERLIDEVP